MKTINEDFDEVEKHRKKTQSNTSKSSHKSKHKHQYKMCLIGHPLYFQETKSTHIRIASYCTICGKIGGNIENRPACEKLDDGYYRMYESDELVQMNNDLELFEIEDWTQKYIPIEITK